MNFKEDATRYPLFFIQVELETGHLDRLGLKVHPKVVKEAEGWSNRVPDQSHRTFLKRNLLQNPICYIFERDLPVHIRFGKMMLE